ncbi:MAG: hypothetical protein ACHQ2Y_01920 [Candidatus Lutacidiplasmatales archaeon]
MHSPFSREAQGGRRARLNCPRCGEPVELVRLRAHLREAHQVSSADLDSTFLEARREVRRGSRVAQR